MPAARGEPAEHRVARGFVVEMERLGIELRSEPLDIGSADYAKFRRLKW